MSKISIFFLIIIVARKVSVSDFGKYNLAMSVVMIFSVINDLGLNIFLFRDLSRNKQEVTRYVSNIFLMRMFLSIIMACITVLFAHIFHYDSLTTRLIYYFIGWITFVNITYVFRTPFKAFEVMHWDAAISIFDNFLRLAFTGLFIYVGLGILGVGLAYLLAAITAFLFAGFIYYRLIGKLDFRLDLNLWKFALNEIRFLAPVAILVPMFGKFDSLILSYFRGEESVGLYNAALKLVWMLVFIPGFVTQATFPKLSQVAFSDRLKYKKIINILLKINFLTTGSISLIIFFGAPLIITSVYGAKYFDSIPLLQVLVWCFPLHGLNGVFIYGFNAMNKQNVTALFVGSTIMLNIIFAVILASQFGYIGVSFATVGSLFFLLSIFVIYGIRENILSVETLRYSVEDIEMCKKILMFKQVK